MSRISTIRDIGNEIRRLEQEKNNIDSQLEHLRGTLAYFESLADDAGVEQSASADVIGAALCGALRAAGVPMHRKTLYETLTRDGVHVGGRAPVDNLSAYLSKDARFKSLGKGMWTLRESQAQPKALNDDHLRDEPNIIRVS